MKLQRFIKKVDLTQKNLRIEDASFLNQIKNVFRLTVGDKIIIADGKGSEGTCEIKSFYKNGVEVTVLETAHNLISYNQSSLYCAIIKKENFELVVQKCTECGIGKIIPIVTERTVKLNLNFERLNKIAIEAAEQCGRADVPEIYSPVKFGDAVLTARDGKNIFLDKNGKNISEILQRGGGGVSIWIGPEGGWTEGELQIAKTNKFILGSLGKNTLRAETAAIVASYLVSRLE